MHQEQKKRGRPRKQITGSDLLQRYPNKTLVWCDETGAIAADQTKPTEYIRPMTKAEELEAYSKVVNEALLEDPRFTRCDPDGTPNPAGSHWRMDEASH